MPKSLDERRQVLLDMKKRFRHLAGEFQEELVESTGSGEGVEDSSAGNSSNEMADAASDVYSAEMAQTMRFRYRDRLADVEEALRRIDDGTYGTCAVCGVTIPEGRLDVMPETHFCVEHAAESLAVDDQPNQTPKPWPEFPFTA